MCSVQSTEMRFFLLAVSGDHNLKHRWTRYWAHFRHPVLHSIFSVQHLNCYRCLGLSTASSLRYFVDYLPALREWFIPPYKTASSAPEWILHSMEQGEANHEAIASS